MIKICSLCQEIKNISYTDYGKGIGGFVLCLPCSVQLKNEGYGNFKSNVENNCICPHCHESFLSFKPNQLVCWICSKKDKNKDFFKSKPKIQERFVQEVKSKHSKIKVIRMEVPKCQVKLNY